MCQCSHARPSLTQAQFVSLVSCLLRCYPAATIVFLPSWPSPWSSSCPTLLPPSLASPALSGWIFASTFSAMNRDLEELPEAYNRRLAALCNKLESAEHASTPPNNSGGAVNPLTSPATTTTSILRIRLGSQRSWSLQALRRARLPAASWPSPSRSSAAKSTRSSGRASSSKIPRPGDPAGVVVKDPDPGAGFDLWCTTHVALRCAHDPPAHYLVRARTA